MHFFRKPKRFGGVKKLDDKSQKGVDRFLGTRDLYKREYELRVKRPLSTSDLAAPLIAPVLGTILQHYKSKANVTYEPLLEVVQAKSSELAQLVKELEAVSE
ncbi:MAG: hypothetical protein ABSA75_13300 [Candidatus Bathyarchaeia archaeon]